MPYTKDPHDPKPFVPVPASDAPFDNPDTPGTERNAEHDMVVPGTPEPGVLPKVEDEGEVPTSGKHVRPNVPKPHGQ